MQLGHCKYYSSRCATRTWTRWLSGPTSKPLTTSIIDSWLHWRKVSCNFCVSMQALYRTFDPTRTFTTSAPRGHIKLFATKTPRFRPLVASRSGVKTLTSSPGELFAGALSLLRELCDSVRSSSGRRGTMLSGKQDEEDYQHIPYSKLSLAGHNLEGISIAGQVSGGSTHQSTVQAASACCQSTAYLHFAQRTHCQPARHASRMLQVVSVLSYRKLASSSRQQT